MTADIFSELGALEGTPAAEREGRAWQLLARADSGSDFDVALDCALEHGLVPMEVSDAIRGRVARPVQAHSYVNPTDGSEMVWIPPGHFQFGGNRQTTDLPGFFLARHPITTQQFQQFVDATGYEPMDDDPDSGEFLSDWTRGRPREGREQHPVVFVSMADAWHYCDWAGLTLPTEYQWEKSARGSDGRKFPWGNNIQRPNAFRRQFQLAQIGYNETCPVGSYQRTRTAFGCEDMLGNVSEWCWAMNSTYWDAPDIPVQTADDLGGAGKYGIVRGACFMRSPWGDGLPLHHRRRLAAIRRNRWVGFRPALTVPGK